PPVQGPHRRRRGSGSGSRRGSHEPLSGRRSGAQYTGLVAEEHGQILEEEPGEKRDPEREARRRLALAQIRQYPDPALRMSAAEIDTFDDDLCQLAERMYVLMTDANGIGLAATQVGVVRRMFVCRLGEDDDAEPVAFVNPVVTLNGDERESADE